MNYASDPQWAHKESMDPYRRQAYENQVMHDRAERDAHRQEFDYAAIVVGAVSFGAWLKQRKVRKANALWAQEHKPADYDARLAEHSTRWSALHADTRAALARLAGEQAEINAELDPLRRRLIQERTWPDPPEYGRLVRQQRAVLDQRKAVQETHAQSVEALDAEYAEVLEYWRAVQSF